MIIDKEPPTIPAYSKELLLLPYYPATISKASTGTTLQNKELVVPNEPDIPISQKETYVEYEIEKLITLHQDKMVSESYLTPIMNSHKVSENFRTEVRSEEETTSSKSRDSHNAENENTGRLKLTNTNPNHNSLIAEDYKPIKIRTNEMSHDLPKNKRQNSTPTKWRQNIKFVLLEHFRRETITNRTTNEYVFNISKSKVKSEQDQGKEHKSNQTSTKSKGNETKQNLSTCKVI